MIGGKDNDRLFARKRQREFRERMIEGGYRRVQSWVHHEDIEQLKKFVDKLNDRRK